MEAKNLDDFIFIYEKFAIAENKSPRTIESVTAAVKDFNKFLGGCPDVKQVKAEDLRRYIITLQEKHRWSGHPHIRTKDDGLSPHTIASYVRSIRAFWSWLKRERFIKHNPCQNVKPPKASRKIVATLTNEQITRLLKSIRLRDQPGYRDYALVMTLYGTGLRLGELLGLRMASIDFDSGQIKVMGKGGKERSVYMSATLFKVLFKCVFQWKPKVASDYLFVHGDGRPLSRFYVEHRLHRYGKKARITGVRCSPHTLRHSFAVNYLRNGGDTFTLQKILGHSTLEMTRHYAEVSNIDVELKQKACSPVEQLGLRV
jgi:integrase/recombinase XerD